ncbi:MAG: heparinase II/III family protein [Candidatus Eremiobacterota bacterium]
MKNPLLDKNLFLTDEVTRRKILFDAGDFCNIAGSVKQKDSALFNFTGRFSVTLTHSNLSGFNTFILKVKNLSKKSLLCGLRLESDSQVFFTGDREFLPSGEQVELNFPVESFASHGTPEWSQIKTLEIIFKTEKTEMKDTDCSILITSLEGIYRNISSGPRLSGTGFRDMVTEDILEITAMSKNHFNCDNPAFFIPSPCPGQIENAEDIMAGIIMGQHISAKDFWSQNPAGSLEWSHFFHRHHFMRSILQGFLDTGDSVYIEFIDRLIKEWIVKNPVPVDSNGGASPSWETLSVAWRLREWFWIRGISGNFLSGETKNLMMRSIWEHCRHLMDYRGHPNNWIIVESSALSLCGMIFPHFRESELWVKEGLRRLDYEFKRQFFPDGVHYEISPLYHAICVNALLDVKVCGEINNITLPEIFNSPLEKCFEYLLYLCRPDFTCPSINDSWSADRSYKELLLFAGKIFNRSDFIWAGTEGLAGTEPEEKIKMFTHAGMAIVRSDFKEDGNYLLFRAGPAGAYHCHDDILSLDITYDGIKRFADPGITSYEPGLLTDYYRSASAHNTILINGRGPDSVSFKDMIKSGADGIFGDGRTVKGAYTGIWDNSEYTVTRKITFMEDKYWLIEDVIDGHGDCTVTVCWNCYGSVEIDKEIINFPDGFSLKPLLKYAGLNCERAEAWVSINGSDRPSTGIKFNLHSNLPVRFLWKLES